MRGLAIGALTMLAACTLLVPIDDDLTAHVNTDVDGGREAGLVEFAKEAGSDGDALAPFDSGEPFGPPRDGCPNGVALDPDLDAYYPFDETSGSVLHDCSRHAHDLEALSAVLPKWSADGHIHGAADFDGKDGCFGSTDSDLNKFESQPFSVSVWVQPRGFYEDNDNLSGRWIVSHKASPKGWHLGTDNETRVELDLEWNAPAGSKTEISADTTANTWVHFAATYDSGKQEAAVYLNGKQTQRISNPEKIPASFGTGANVFFRIGCRTSGSGVFDGKLDELRIYPRVITDEQIAALAKAR